MKTLSHAKKLERPVTSAVAPSPFISPMPLLSDGKRRMSRPRPQDKDDGRAAASEREKAMQWMILDGQSVREGHSQS